MTTTPGDTPPAEAIAAEARQLAVNIAAAFEPDAVRIIDGNPHYLISALLECTRRVMDEVVPLIAARTAAAERQRIRDQLSAAITDLRDAGDERRAMWLGALADLLAAEPQETP